MFLNVSDAARTFVIAFCCLLLSFGGHSFAGDWWQFRGPAGGEAIESATWPNRWSESENLAWSTEIPGQGWSSPIIIGDRVFVTSAESDEIGRPSGFGEGVAAMGSYRRSQGPQQPVNFQVTCLNLGDGSVIWNKSVAEMRPPSFFHPSNTFATETPTTDGEFLYVTFQAVGVVACLDLDGDIIWEREFGAFETGNDFGTGSSLAYHDGKLFVQNDNEEQSFLVCLDASTGDNIWRKDRASSTCWSSPLIWHNTQGIHLVVCGSDGVICLDPSSGDEIWSLTGMGGSFSSSPVADQERVYFGNSGPGRRGPLVAVNATARGDLRVANESLGIAWVARAAGPGMSSPVVIDGLLYVVSRGIIACHDAATGEEVYKNRLRNADNVAASPVIDENRIVLLNESGDANVLKTGREFELESENSLPGLFWSTPSASKNAILLRSADQIHCIRVE